MRAELVGLNHYKNARELAGLNHYKMIFSEYVEFISSVFNEHRF